MKIEGLGSITNKIIKSKNNHSIFKIKKMIRSIDVKSTDAAKNI